MLCVFLGCPRIVTAQDAAEYGSATSSTSGNGARSKPLALPQLNVSDRSGSAHLIQKEGPPAEVVNRRRLEERSGKEAAKLLLRSAPTGARVWANGLFVGRTPVLLVLAPGSYAVEMRGQNLEWGQRRVDLLPRETRHVVLPLSPKYPTSVRMR